VSGASWTGGQYSVYRALLGLHLLWSFANPAPDLYSQPAVAALQIAGVALALCLALGVADRVVAVVGASVWASLLGESALASPVLLGPLLLAHACVPGRPYGSWGARGRADPGGGWRLPAWLSVVAWIALAVGHAFSAWIALSEPLLTRSGWAVLALDLAFAPLALVARARPWLWLVSILASASVPLLLLHLLAADPRWAQPRRGPKPARLFFDGDCGLCHRVVRFVLAEDPEGTAFRYAPLARLPAQVAQGLPDSLVVELPGGALLVRARAVREVGERLGGLWRALAIASRAIPTAWLDRIYDGVARVRGRLFARPPDACPLVSVDLRARFD
jgi:predicted DCC family thiol-disulfide oxidoreductase YuxK